MGNHKIRLEFVDSYKLFFEALGLVKFEDFYNFSDGDLINKNTKRNVVYMKFNIDGQSRDFFMKRFHKPYLKDTLHTILNHGAICTQALSEYKFALHLLEKGIETYHPVCFGEKTIFGLEQESFMITEKINGVSLTEFVTTNFESMPLTEKVKLVAAIGRFVRRIHYAGINMVDLFVWHLFVLNKAADSSDDYQFAVIDLHRLKINVHLQYSQLRNLGALDYSMNFTRFDDQLRDVLLDSYIGSKHYLGKETIRAILLKRANTLRRRRNVPEY